MNTPDQQTIENQNSINWDKLEKYLRAAMPDLPKGPLEIQKFSEGYSNLTYLLKIADWEAVMRRPPFGKVPPKAHDMQREFRMLGKVNPVFPLAPTPHIYCEDPAIMEKHFYIMEKKKGIVMDEALPLNYGKSEEVGPVISKTVIQTLVELQSINYKEAGLEKMGKPEGFLERQVNGWTRRYESSRTGSAPYLREFEKWLSSNVPDNREVTIVHNDFKLNNMVFDEQHPGRVTGVLDWELSTIGDPLSDVGASIVYWGQKGDPDMGINIVTDQLGFFSRREFIEEYVNQSGRDVSDINYYIAFGFYKLAVILQQLYYRWETGEIKDERFGEMNLAVANLFEMANLARTNKLV